MLESHLCSPNRTTNRYALHLPFRSLNQCIQKDFVVGAAIVSPRFCRTSEVPIAFMRFEFGYHDSSDEYG